MISTIIVRYRLLLENKKFEELKEKMDAEIRHADGFLDKTDLPLIPDEPYHSVILRFDSKANAEAWQNAPLPDVKRCCRKWMAVMQEGRKYYMLILLFGSAFHLKKTEKSGNRLLFLSLQSIR